jgi:polyhydroxyalkanoate synthesis regulator phasin
MSILEHEIGRLPEIFNRIMNETPDYIVNFSERKYRPSHLKIAPRTINIWSEKDILPFKNDSGWHKFNLTECVWLKIVYQLDRLNISYDEIKKFKDQLFRKIEFPKALENKKIIKKIQEALKKNNLHEISEIINSSEYMASLKEEEMTLLNLLVIDVIFTLKNIRLLFSANGDDILMCFIDGLEDDVKDIAENKSFLKGTHISISLNQILFEITNEIIEDNDLRKLKLVSEAESNILDAIKGNGVSKIEILYNNEDKPKLLKVTSKNKLDCSMRIKEMILNGEYQDIKITTANGNVISYENTRKIKLDL